ncbi:hypothetical protein [Corallococcus sp. RDP092CA]|uniref:hypothetical protein n=1 Tax=Corallococcus sp. RDP092CA TaxID=3109369 RepID=UPI0035AE63A6
MRACGATYVSGQDVPLSELGKKLGPLDVIDEAVGVPKVAFAVLEAPGSSGLSIFTGIPAHGTPSPVDGHPTHSWMPIQEAPAPRTGRGGIQQVVRLASSRRG